MSKEEVLGYFYKNSSEYGVKTTLLILLCGLAVGMIIYLTYYISSEKIAYNRKFNWSLVTLHLITVVVMLMISSNIAVSLGMVGALSIVRFRNAVKNPMDLLYLFWSISAGIIVGVGLYVLAFVLCIVMTVLLLVLDLVPNAKAPDLLVLRALATEVDYGEVEKILKENCKYHKEKSRSIKNGESELIIEIKTAKKEELLEAFSKVKCMTQINCISHDGECRA